MAGERHGHGMASVNQTRPHCVNQMGKTQSKPLVARHGRGKAWARHRHGMGEAWARHGCSMASVNQTRPHCVNQMGKTQSKPLSIQHGRGTAWARYATCESAFMQLYNSACDCKCVENILGSHFMEAFSAPPSHS